jgi:cystathionine beta-synthase
MGTPDDVTVAIKCEWFNPAGSIKDRTAVEMVNQAEVRGELAPGGTIVEATSGNTGAGLAMVAAQRGYRCVLVCSDKVSPEKVALLRALGAEVHVCPVAVAPDDPRSYYSVATRLEAEIPGAWRAGQYANPDNIAAHERTTGPEIWADTDGRVTHVVVAAGTGGTVTGVARSLKARNPDVRVIAADAAGSVYSGGDGRPYLLEGAGEDFWPATYDPDAPDAVVPVTDADAFATARRYASNSGILLGGSGGAALWVACAEARRAPAGSLIVAVAPDSGRAYLSRFYDDAWYAAHGFEATETGAGCEGGRVGDVLTEQAVRHFPWVRPTATVAEARAELAAGTAGFVVVLGDPPPAVPAEVVGVVWAATLDDETLDPHAEVGAIVDPPLPLVGVHQDVAVLDEAVASHGGALVMDAGRVRAAVGRCAAEVRR